MPQPPMTRELVVEAIGLVEQYGSAGNAANAIGVPRSTIESRLKAAPRFGLTRPGAPASLRAAAYRGEVGGPPIPDIAKPPEGFAIHRNAGEYDADGNLRKQWVGTKRDAGGEYETPAGHVIKGESALLDADGRVLSRWVKTKQEGGGELLVDALRQAFADYEGKAPVIPKPSVANSDLLVVYPLPDLHVGMLSWGAETGADWDIKIATDVITRSVAQLVAQSRPSKYATVLGLGDLFHTNDQTNATPANKHRLDADGRWPRIFTAGAKLMTSIVDMVARKHQSVEVVCLQGNHDPDSSVCLTVALSLFYSKNPRITVYDKPGLTWYRRHGRCLIGAHHGHAAKMQNLAMQMAADCPADWGETTWRSFYTGHVHHESAKEVGPVRVESFTTPVARDAYAQGAGYRSGRALSAITLHSRDGEVGRHRVNIVARPQP